MDINHYVVRGRKNPGILITLLRYQIHFVRPLPPPPGERGFYLLGYQNCSEHSDGQQYTLWKSKSVHRQLQPQII